ncbi:regulator [Vibrio fluvialis]|nr:regulator [Vibrio fluvialis]MBY8194018.1 regulator [Vibrio fluvialis]
MKYHEMTKNYIFREFECGLTREQTAELCFKSVRTITEWDKGKPIPPECKRLMRISSNRDISPNELWQGFRMHYDRLELPTGRLVTAQEILTAIAILEINAPDDVRLSTRILKYARCINRIRDKK